MNIEKIEKFDALCAHYGTRERYEAMSSVYRHFNTFEDFSKKNVAYWDAAKLSVLDQIAKRINWIKNQGLPFFDYDEWLTGKFFAQAKQRKDCEDRRRQAGDAEIIGASQAAIGHIVGTQKWTKSCAAVLSTVIKSCTTTGMLFMGAEGLAINANVSRRTAFSVRDTLEQLGVLIRVSTGGKNEAGKTCANRYYIKYNTLRELLGVHNKWKSKYADIPDATGAHRFFNSDGYAHVCKYDRVIRKELHHACEAGLGFDVHTLIAKYGAGHISGIVKNTTKQIRKRLHLRLRDALVNSTNNKNCTLIIIINKNKKYKQQDKYSILQRSSASWLKFLPIDARKFLEQMSKTEQKDIIEFFNDATQLSAKKTAQIAATTIRNRHKFYQKREKTQLSLQF